VTLTFTLTCTSSVSGKSASASTDVVERSPPPPNSGGGGAFDLLSLIFGLSIAGASMACRWFGVWTSRLGAEELAG
jgi:hypothetical protein